VPSVFVLPHRDEYINIYNEQPTNNITLDEFLKLSLDRLHVLKKIESMWDS